MGLLGFAILPLSFELCLEITYPLDQAAGISLIYFVGQILAFGFILADGWLLQPLPQKFQDIEVRVHFRN